MKVKLSICVILCILGLSGCATTESELAYYSAIAEIAKNKKPVLEIEAVAGQPIIIQAKRLAVYAPNGGGSDNVQQYVPAWERVALQWGGVVGTVAAAYVTNWGNVELVKAVNGAAQGVTTTIYNADNGGAVTTTGDSSNIVSTPTLNSHNTDRSYNADMFNDKSTETDITETYGESSETSEKPVLDEPH